MPWIPRMLRGQKVLARCDESGRPIADAGRVEIRYKPNDGRAYKALVANLEPIAGSSVLPDDHCGPAEAPPPKETAAKKSEPRKSTASRAAGPTKADAIARGVPAPKKDGAIVVYADGACSGNPGPAGLGILIDEGGATLELSEYLGTATNNIAELTAILRVAEKYAGDPRPIEIRTDSQYAIGVLSKGWKAKANTDLVAEVKRALARMTDVHLTYVPGHAGVAGNERADELARAAVTARRSSGWVEPRDRSPRT